MNHSTCGLYGLAVVVADTAAVDAAAAASNAAELKATGQPLGSILSKKRRLQ